ncbi:MULTISPECIES: ArsR/SmtB family transcription factor [Thermoanaerobacterium]|uniref:ArsR family transcriptional regulator n=2 Tax=Thermoanaerobacterium TaxID=28895 RepID=W9EJB1_9THEO|nr:MULTISPECIES: metalloregulator ArsR/SmtB family transcription factor [Thermoanaerobacterium]AFK85277.1 transcriptional regulator, ArsR family [Thermoanaerobacterium saccharolyticum JW/SL-YS485]ETO39774.1 ArsR family transcriptional regulator [Thermoanaerobacterium aotearoense SCUT27]
MNNQINKDDICEITVIHADIVEKVKKLMPEEEKLYDLAELFKIFGDTTRIKILCVLLKSEMCVCDIAATLGMNQSAVSHQLRILKQSKLVKHRKEGKVAYYSLADDHVTKIFDQGFSHIEE